MTTRALFGGAITATMPADLQDASDIRQVPDTQEVFLYPHANVSIIIEVLQRVAPDHPLECIKFHYASLTHDNEADPSVIHEVDLVPHKREGDATPHAIILAGTQHVRKFNHTTPDEVKVHMAVYRVKEKGIDLVLTMNVPVKTDDGKGVTPEQALTAAAEFREMATSLTIVDYGLFA